MDLLSLIWQIYKYTWWIFTPALLYAIFKPMWLSYAVGGFVTNLNYTILRIKIPKDEMISPKAMESVLAGLYGSLGTITVMDFHVRGVVKKIFSLEIVSIEGDVGFYVVTSKDLQSFTERLFYSQFPDIEITEVEDYTNNVPPTVPDDHWDLFGQKWILEKGNAMPITTYPFFEDKFSGEMVDPLSTFLEAMGSLGSGKHCWLQINLVPPPADWRKEGFKAIEDILAKYNMSLTDSEGSMMRVLPPHEMDVIKAINSKLNKPAFSCQIMFAYIARKEVFTPADFSLTSGAFKQFESGDMNGFMTDKFYSTSVYYFGAKSRRKYRKRRFLDMMRNRDMQGELSILNSEELATLFHFPTVMMRVPTLPRLESKRAAAPPNLPVTK